jgi:hypothetical protein
VTVTIITAFFALKLGLLVFWGLWYVIAFTTNLCEGFQELKIFPNTWQFASGNLRAVTEATNTYSPSRRLPRLLFFGVLGWQLMAAFLFTAAIVASMFTGSVHAKTVNAAFIVGLGLWSAFMVADEMLKQYDVEHTHVLFFLAQLLTLVAIHVLPS